MFLKVINKRVMTCLPKLPETFVPNPALTQKLVRAIMNGQCPVNVIFSPYGSGKTTFTIFAINYIQNNYTYDNKFDKIHFVDAAELIKNKNNFLSKDFFDLTNINGFDEFEKYKEKHCIVIKNAELLHAVYQKTDIQSFITSIAEIS